LVQLFQRYVPYSSVVDFVVQSLLCFTAFLVTVQFAWHANLDPTLPSLVGVRVGRTLTTAAVLITVFYLTGHFERRNHLSVSRFVPRLLQAVPIAAATLALLYQFVPTVALRWPVAGSGLALMTLFMVAWHATAPAIMRREALADRVVVLGEGGLARQIAAGIEAAEPWGFDLVGYVPVAEPSRPRGRVTRADGGATALAVVPDQVLPFPTPERLEAPSLGRLADVEAILDQHDVHTVVVALDDRRGNLPLGTLVNAKLRGIQVYDAVEFYERLTGRMLVSRMRPSTIIFADGFVPGRATLFVKRFLDATAAAALLLLTAPLMACVGLAVALTSRGPALFRQQRVGLSGLPFTMIKFRTMREDSEAAGPQWAAENDSRVTPIGRFLRKSRLDELPQLWNILLGQMSFVGPRPEQPDFVRTLRRAIPYYDQRHAVRPGLTGWAQVKYPYGASVEESEEKLEYDLYYIKHLSVAPDSTKKFETVRVLLTGKGAR